MDLVLFAILCLGACTEKYNFVVIDESGGIVIEAFISNQSYNRTLTYPSDGRHFSESCLGLRYGEAYYGKTVLVVIR